MQNNFQFLSDNGYLILRNGISKNNLLQGLSCIKKTGIDYSIMKSFIDDICLPTLSQSVGFNSPHYMKFRFSNSENLKDAALFHGDMYNFTSDKIMKIYTGLCYFDKAILQIIPGSHLNGNINYNEKIDILLNPGDILLMHANIYHRGIGNSDNVSRRLLQIFEIILDPKLYTTYKTKMKTVITANNTIMQLSNKFNIGRKISNTSDLMEKYHYFLLQKHWNYKVILLDINDYEKNDSFVGYEPGDRAQITNGIQKWNVNMIVENHNVIYSSNSLQIICIVTLIIILYILYKKMNKR
jgi:hypothetical protein